MSQKNHATPETKSAEGPFRGFQLIVMQLNFLYRSATNDAQQERNNSEY